MCSVTAVYLPPQWPQSQLRELAAEYAYLAYTSCTDLGRWPLMSFLFRAKSLSIHRCNKESTICFELFFVNVPGIATLPQDEDVPAMKRCAYHAFL